MWDQEDCRCRETIIEGRREERLKRDGDKYRSM